MVEKWKNGVNIEHEHHLFKLANVHGSEAEQKKKKRQRGNAYDCMPPDSKGTLWMQWNVSILSGSP